MNKNEAEEKKQDEMENHRERELAKQTEDRLAGLKGRQWLGLKWQSIEPWF